MLLGENKPPLWTPRSVMSSCEVHQVDQPQPALSEAVKLFLATHAVKVRFAL